MANVEVAQPPRNSAVACTDQFGYTCSSSLRYTDYPCHHNQNRHLAHLSEYTENGSIGYGSCAPLESESSYSSHPGYPPSPKARIYRSPPTSVLRSASSPPNSCASRSSSTPSSGVYVDLPVAKLPNACSNDNSKQDKRRRNVGTLLANNVRPAAAVETAASTLRMEHDSSGFVVDSQKGNAYYKGQLLGKGGFAKVYLITDISSKKQFACKIIPTYPAQKLHLQKIAREVMIHKDLNHINVVKLHHYFEDSYNAYMLLEACPKRSLMEVLKYRGKVTEPEARYYMKQMSNGVAYIHSRKVVHRDLKPGNMFLSDKMVVKIGDFGLATRPDGQKKKVTLCGTPNYIAPEVLFKQSCSYEADVWALGCILYALLVGQPPFEAACLKDTYARICSHRYRELDDSMASRAGQDLVQWLLQPNPELRPSLELVKEHHYLTKEYSPSTLPDTCCYQAPIALFPDSQIWQRQQQQHQRVAAPAQEPQQLQPKKKKKVSAWLAGLKLPKLPKFRQRINSVLCMEARKKQGVVGTEQPRVSPCLAMSRALEDCLSVARSNGSGKVGHSVPAPPRLDARAPLFVTKWIDYSNKHGLAFQLSDMSVGVLFNDGTKMSYTSDRKRVEYVTSDDVVTRYNREKNVPAYLRDKLELIQNFADYMDQHLTEGGEIMDGRTRPKSRSRQKSECVPLMRRWVRTSKAIIMEMNVPLLQMNFFSDHTKLIVSQDSESHNYLVTYVDGNRRASTYWLHDLRDYGCSLELHERLLYIYKVAKEFGEPVDESQHFAQT